MNEEIRAAMRQTYREMGEAILKDERRLASFLADILGNRYPGERLLLRQLVQTGLPRMIAEGGVTAENLPDKAAYVSQTYFWDKEMTLAAARVWFETLKGKIDSEESVKELRDKAEKGDADAWQALLELAEQGNADAQFHLGLYYCEDIFEGCLEEEKAEFWYRKAAEQGHKPAQLSLEKLRLRKLFEKAQAKLWDEDNEEDEEALHSLQELAAKGNVDAQYLLGLYFLGDGESVYEDEESIEKTLFWLRKAAEQGAQNAQLTLGKIYYAGVGVDQDFKEASEWFCKLADRGIASAQYIMGDMYNYGKGVPQNRKKALEWYRKAEEQGYLAATYRKAAEQGDAHAQYDLSNMYCDGDSFSFFSNRAEDVGLPIQDYELYLYWRLKAADGYQKMAESGDARAQFNLAEMYYWGVNRVLKVDYKKSAMWYRKAAEQGKEPAQYCLGQMYEDGRGVKRNYGVAAAWYRKAVEQGDRSGLARNALRRMEERGLIKKRGSQSTTTTPQAMKEQHFNDKPPIKKGSDTQQRERLLDSIAQTIQDYRDGDLPQPVSAHVERWVQQFDDAVQVPILYEMDHVLKRSYFPKERVARAFRNAIHHQPLTGNDAKAFWTNANFLDIQGRGNSQTEMLTLFSRQLQAEYGFGTSDCGRGEEVFIGACLV